jgi:hypothetical protein
MGRKGLFYSHILRLSDGLRGPLNGLASDSAAKPEYERPWLSHAEKQHSEKTDSTRVNCASLQARM